jgi:hypothetical protein
MARCRREIAAVEGPDSGRTSGSAGIVPGIVGLVYRVAAAGEEAIRYGAA